MPKYSQPGRFVPVSVSQNFLTGSETIRRIVRIARLSRTDHVIEIGAGKGHITRELAARCGRVSAYEIDRKLAARLHETAQSNVRVIASDFLTAELPKDGSYKVFSNIPFNRTSEIIRKLTESETPPDEAWLIMEKGASKRFLGQPYESRASLLLKPFFDAEIRYYFRREDFHPMPSVDTVLLRLVKKAMPDIPFPKMREYALFLDKQLKTPPAQPRVSGQTLYIQWLCLFRRLSGNRKKRKTRNKSV